MFTSGVVLTIDNFNKAMGEAAKEILVDHIKNIEQLKIGNRHQHKTKDLCEIAKHNSAEGQHQKNRGITDQHYKLKIPLKQKETTGESEGICTSGQ
ncbi:hypothetical protein PoB_004124200 [Plakobranchus ocellatus]|uniref:Uncharacterized protein n=1 Tax=Plakobranchus ocellatus TaxID=259542 RepID=A0AAV4B5G0_9GAST|nr:hypothetical protein PoB_004124200 [Plakobranchus ocellatus]